MEIGTLPIELRESNSATKLRKVVCGMRNDNVVVCENIVGPLKLVITVVLFGCFQLGFLISLKLSPRMEVH